MLKRWGKEGHFSEEDAKRGERFVGKKRKQPGGKREKNVLVPSLKALLISHPIFADKKNGEEGCVERKEAGGRGNKWTDEEKAPSRLSGGPTCRPKKWVFCQKGL